MKKIIILLFLGAVFSLPIQAESKGILEDLKIQNIELAAQNIELRNSIATNQSIYFGALGFSGAFLIVFLGVNIYFSKTRADEDRDKIESLLKERLNQATLLMKNELKVDLDLIKVQHKEMIGAYRENILKELNTKAESTESQIKYLDYRITIIDYEALSDSSSSKLVSAMKVIKKAEDIGWEWKTASMLTKVESHLDTGLKFYPAELSDVFTQLSNIKFPNNSLAKKLEAKILSTQKQS
ncbi:hypothetical protein [Vibrio cyclitrophicus]|uniref:hypothetical protein n=1 Tax=Vibrio cyclitrophicus TaxID=47951 RepID=UPI0010568DF8|nr:hypothetical protein [Vibrio cyclitrophicus]